MNTAPSDLPLVVDLDGTLVLTDTLHELALDLVRERPLHAPAMVAWLAGGKAQLKRQLALRAKLDVTTLPYNQPLLDWLKSERANGRELVLCTAADALVAQAIAAHLGIFAQVLASDGATNLSAERKAARLVAAYGERGFDYAGNSRDDLPVWARARAAIVVNAAPAVARQARQTAAVAREFPAETSGARGLLRMLRPHQWLKNLLLFVPLLASHHWGGAGAVAALVLAFVAFSLCASAVYIANDLLDLPSDRRHPRKRARPLASGRVPLARGLAIAPLLLLASVALALLVGPAFMAWLAVYFLLTCWYSVTLKRLVLLDCATLAALYTLRVIAGAAAAGISSSEWLLAVSGFVFLSLSFLKRYTELVMVAGGTAGASLHGRGYVAQDAPLVRNLGVASGYAATVVLALYLHGDTAVTLYRLPEALLLAVGVLVYWINWMWLKAHRLEMHDDPVFFAIRDRVSLYCGAVFAATLLLATTGLPW